ncbi:solute carrier family 26 member 6 isoform X3 [Globicephala melas]|uniref:solute carrier family 26 member 6 isoform X3 n=1 Tax=Globicephala melas TaxID=9731 RepID=UPI00293D432C|nr:solute carrier family 26 member 6 isoform X4 [Globicephala melas]
MGLSEAPGQLPNRSEGWGGSRRDSSPCGLCGKPLERRPRASRGPPPGGCVQRSPGPGGEAFPGRGELPSRQRDTQALLSTTQAMELRRRDYHVERPLLNQEQLEELGSRSSATGTLQWRTWFRCSHARARALLLQYFPVLAWLPQYPVRDWLLGDLLSGLSVAIMQLPQGLAYALLAGLPPVFGLYSSFYPVFIYFLFGTSRHISVGTFAVMSVMVGSVTESLAPDEAFLQASNSTVDVAARDAARVQVASTLSVLVGLFQVGLGLVHFGFVVTYLSEPLVRAYTTAASVQVFVSQLKYVFGLHLSSRSGPLSLIYLIGATGISYGVGLQHRFGVDVVGKIPAGLVPPVAPSPQLFARLVGNAFAIAVVGFAIAISLGKIFALRHGYRVDSNQELVALGLSNLIGGIFQCFPVSCSMSRSLVQESTGGNTQVAGAISSLFILIIIVKLGELFQDLPKAVLAAVIIVNLKGMLMQFTDICSLWKANRVDLLIWLVTFVATILLNLDLGLAVAVVFSLLLVVVRTQLPHYAVLGQVPDTDIYRDVAEYSEAREVPGVKVFRSSATMYFANAELYSDTLKQRCGVNVDHLISQKKKLLRKQELKLKRLQKENKLPKQAAASKGTSISINVNTSVTDIESNDVEGSKAKQVSAGTELEDTAARGQEDAKAPDMSSLKTLGLPQPDFHSLILDLSSLSFVDTVCLKSLKNLPWSRSLRRGTSSMHLSPSSISLPLSTMLSSLHSNTKGPAPSTLFWLPNSDRAATLPETAHLWRLRPVTREDPLPLGCLQMSPRSPLRTHAHNSGMEVLGLQVQCSRPGIRHWPSWRSMHVFSLRNKDLFAQCQALLWLGGALAGARV